MLFLTVPWVGLQCVIVAFPVHTHLLFKSVNLNKGLHCLQNGRRRSYIDDINDY